ncbi:DUF1735 domain-containing protein [Chitinophaga sp. SYP-B3965]|uniref:DUF1735 and LamG domain-containing protein n=1 Tax=Chitinophaga sp. SYP-B3965 TaxID=2663120 RepID=UPI0012996F45|nr:DUF1735 and LamG domain-containing protein [Chitinophaga sp. SYP-B3965]MRG48319.1 DUF1735 domain-containing protein [Chitinophaga sp. SYP-B3965]
MKKLNYKIWLITAAVFCVIAVVVPACQKYVDFKDVILMTGTENDPLVKFTVENAPSSFSVSATATAKVESDITVNFAIDSSLVTKYNKEVNANYFFPPEGSYELSAASGTIKAGTHISEPVTVRILSTANLVDGKPYIIPVTIKSTTGSLDVLETSRTIYLKVARVIDFKSIDISSPNFYATYPFTEPYNNVTQYTFEIKCYINDWHTGNPPISRLCNWGPLDESLPNLLRFGEAGSKVNQLQWVSSEGSVFSTTEFATKTWYTISCVYDGNSYKLYINGKLDGSFEGAGRVYQFAMLELGMSYSGYQTSQRFLGRTAEVRFWSRALSMTEIQEGLCGVDAAANGLVAYWKMNEGSGNTFFDRTGHGRDLTWPKAVLWNADSDNKCAQ